MGQYGIKNYPLHLKQSRKDVMQAISVWPHRTGTLMSRCGRGKTSWLLLFNKARRQPPQMKGDYYRRLMRLKLMII